MIINIRGTHGSGKTRLVRYILKQFRKQKPFFIDGRKHPIGYLCDKTLFIVGHYEGDASGGCDTVPKVDLMYQQIRRYASKGYDVLFEGILAQHSATRLFQLIEEGYDVRAIQLDIPVKRSIRSVKQRRRARGNRKPLNPQNIIREAHALTVSAKRLKSGGVRIIRRTTRRDARILLLKWLNLS